MNELDWPQALQPVIVAIEGGQCLTALAGECFGNKAGKELSEMPGMTTFFK